MSVLQILVKMVGHVLSTQQRAHSINVRAQVDTREVLVEQVSFRENIVSGVGVLVVGAFLLLSAAISEAQNAKATIAAGIVFGPRKI